MILQRRKRSGLKEVANAAGTSIATASRVLNNTGYISEETRARVLQAAAALNYSPNLRAKGLRQQRSHFIGLLLPNLLNAYYTTLADAISQLLAGRDYQILLSSTRDDPAPIGRLRRRRPDLGPHRAGQEAAGVHPGPGGPDGGNRQEGRKQPDGYDRL